MLRNIERGERAESLEIGIESWWSQVTILYFDVRVSYWGKYQLSFPIDYEKNLLINALLFFY